MLKNLKISVFENHDEILADWQSIEKYATDYSSCSAWSLAWFDAYKNNPRCSPFVIIGKSPIGTTEFLLPFMKWKIGSFNLLIRPGVKHSAYYSGIFSSRLAKDIKRGNCQEFWSHILASIPGVDVIWLEGVPKFELGLFGNEETFISSNSCSRMQIDDDWDSQYLRLFKSKTRNNDKRCIKNLSKIGGVRFSVVKDIDEQKKLLFALLSQKNISLRKMGASTAFEKPEIIDFYDNLLETHDKYKRSNILLSKLCLDDKILSANLGVAINNQFHGMIFSTTDSDERRHSPGRLLLLEFNKYLSENGITTHDFGTGTSEFKNAWCDETVDRFHVLIPRGLKGNIVARTIKIFATTKALLKKSKYKLAIIRVLGFGRRLQNFATGFLFK